MLLLMTNRNLHMRFRLAARLMTLDDLELLYVWIFSEFRVISQISEATTAKRMTIDLYCQRCIDYVDRLDVPPLGGLQSQYRGWKWRFSTSTPKISRNSQTVSNPAIPLLLTINCKFAVHFFARVFIHAQLSRAYLCVSSAFLSSFLPRRCGPVGCSTPTVYRRFISQDPDKYNGLWFGYL